MAKLPLLWVAGPKVGVIDGAGFGFGATSGRERFHLPLGKLSDKLIACPGALVRSAVSFGVGRHT